MKPITVKPVAVTKFVVSLIVGIGTRTIVRSVIENNTSDPETRTQKVTSGAAGAVIGMMAAERTKSWTDRKIDMFVDAWHNAEAQKAEKQTEDPK